MVSKYKIFGSTVFTKLKPEELFELTAENNEKFKNIVAKCNCVVYDISSDESQIAKALTALAIIEQDIERQKSSSSRNSSPPVLFILISTCMTWALTPRMDPTDLDPIPFVESDHRRRKPHPNYKEHYDCEKEVIKKGRKLKGKLRTMVIFSGITYGFEEDMLAFLFKRAWSNDNYLPIFGSGSNFIPLIHVADLAQLICKLIDIPMLKGQYILAVEQTPASLKYIVKYISRTLGSGKIKYVVAEEAYLYPEIDHNIFDCLTANIVMEPEYLTSLEIAWTSEMNFVENIEAIVDEFKTHRNLEPLKIVIHGPPCSGKTKLAHLLCEHYNLNYVSIKSILDSIEMKAPKLKSTSYASQSTYKSKTRIKGLDKFNLEYEDIEQLLNEEDVQNLLDLENQDSEDENYQRTVMDEYRKCLPRDFPDDSTRLSDEYVMMLLRLEMLKNHSQTLGFVVDGFPKTFREAIWLFRNDNYRYSADDNSTNKSNTKYDIRLVPNYVIDLNAPNTFLLDRISHAPEEFIQNTHYNERDMVRRLMAFRDRNKKDSGPINYFHQCETEIVEINVSEFPSENMKCIFYICTKIIGPPRGFGLSQNEMKEFEVVKQFQEKFRNEQEKLQKELQIQNEKKQLDKKMKKLLEKYHHINVRLERILAPKIEKYRTFMANNILPILFEAIMKVVETRPNNPIDYLAEYLFKHNPKGQMYNPKYSRNGEKPIAKVFSLNLEIK
ncbi:adenylate kinase 7-like isoform X2 [Harmonia axyridis]|nr:adenylate kinase 7-like isoform X2 [Harmonia axyridis]